MAVVDDLGHPDAESAVPAEDFGRQPPQDLAAEQSVLGGMLLSKDAIADVLERLRPGDFYRPAHQNVYDAILDLYGRGEPADAVTVAAELDRRGLLRRIGGAPYLHTLISTVPTAANAGYYAGIVAEKALLRRLVEAGTRVVQYGYAGAEGADVHEIVDRAQAEIYEVTDRRASEDFVPLEELLQPTMDEIDAIASNGGLARGVPTGFTELDEVTNGLHPGQMIIVAARPGVGKALALDTPLPTPTGWTTMGDVGVGDELIGADGERTHVVAATDILLGRPCYEVEFTDGTVIVADAAHQWPTARGICTTVALRSGVDVISASRMPALVGAGGRNEPAHGITDVRRVASVPVRCVQVNNASRLYLAGPSMIPTHNSTLGLDFMRSCSIKHRMASVIFSLEMSKPEIVMRLLSAEAKIKLADMRSGRMSDDDWTRLARRMSEISEAPLYIDDSPNLTMMEIRAKARRLSQKSDLRLVVIDYMQLMTSGKKFESRQQEVSEFSRNLKLLAKELDVPVVAISQLNRGPEQRTDKKPMVSDLRESGCLTASTRILRADNGTEITLGELIRTGQRPLVWSLDEDNRLVARQMTNVFFSGHKEVFRLRLASGREVQATGNHPFLTPTGWAALADVVVGDVIAVPRRVPEPVCVQSLADDDVLLLARQVNAKSAVPPVVFALPRHQVVMFLEQLSLLHHGKIARTGATMQWAIGDIYYSSPSRRVVDDVAQLLLRVGVFCSIECVDNAGVSAVWQLRICASDQYHNNSGHSGQAARSACDGVGGEFPGLSGPGTSSGVGGGKANSSVAVCEREHSSCAAEDIIWDRVIEITGIGSHDVYDGTVPGTHNFVAQGITVHNSLEQDADMVILLHRPDAFERDDPRGGEADLILGKHRNGPTKTITVAHQLHLSRFTNMAR